MILLCFVTFMVKNSLAQDFEFPHHLDLQKVGDIIFNNEKFNVLKPTTHTIVDYFKEFMLHDKTNNKDPTERILIDDNGLRHKWSGYEKKYLSLRKMHIKKNPIDLTVEKTNENNNINNDSETKIRVTPRRKKRVSSTPASNLKNMDEENTKVSERLGLRNNGKDGKERVIAKTTIFCPFLGVITTATYLD